MNNVHIVLIVNLIYLKDAQSTESINSLLIKLYSLTVL